MIDTSTIETIEACLKNIAVRKKMGDTAEGATQWFTSKNEEWLLLFDNADQPNIDLNMFLPQCSHGNIIITTRNPGLCVYAGEHSHVQDMEDDAVTLLLKSAVLDNILQNRSAAATVVKVGPCCTVYLPN
jgi:hypothetical protein